ncbi:MAG: glycine--tRNA ligase subunit beta [Syntrophorhabdales bacterium]
MKPFLLEIGCEELPARFIKPAKEGLWKLVKEGLDNLRIGSGEARLFGTPRRIALLIDGLEEKQRETVTVKFGPPAARAFDGSGKPTSAAVGFARSQGVDVSELKVKKKETAELICVEKVETGRDTREVLAALLPDAIARIPFQKRMRWGRGAFEFGRPIHWVCALLGDEIIHFDVAGVSAGNVSKGHRFLSKGGLVVTDISRYPDEMRDRYVIVDEEERMAMMMEDIRAIEAKTGARAVADRDLLEEIRYITEYPHGLKGSFEDTYLELPRAVLVNVMKGHQRYIPLEREDGSLAPSFIFFANTIPLGPDEVIRGNEKVLRARLADARFFFEEDKRTRLETLYGRLDAVMFHKRLGNLKDKAERVADLGVWLASLLGLPLEANKVQRAAMLMKADLLTHMVGEFPELQGTMGRIYAEYQGEEQEVARSIEEHYYPTGTDATLPQTALGSVMALADRMDSLIAFFSVAITPTGNLDPFALRRQAIGSIKIIIDKAYHVPQDKLIEKGYEALAPVAGRVPLDALRTSLSEFIATRFKFLMMEEGHNQEFVNAVLPHVSVDIHDAHLRLLALETQGSIEDFRRLMVGFKRVYNITKSLNSLPGPDPSLFEQKEERDLYKLFEASREPFGREVEDRRYAGAIAILVGFKETIDNYFDKVFVMVEDEGIKNNRLSLLTGIKDMFLRYGDFSKIRVEELT